MIFLTAWSFGYHQTNRNHRSISELVREVQASAPKTHLPRLLDEIERGETIIITQHGRPIARIVREVSPRQREIDEAVDDMSELAKTRP
jgi:antitoxin (DNA-binding transcriptional repressor) of toxin-antitoxin stability system